MNTLSKTSIILLIILLIFIYSFKYVDTKPIKEEKTTIFGLNSKLIKFDILPETGECFMAYMPNYNNLKIFKVKCTNEVLSKIDKNRLSLYKKN